MPGWLIYDPATRGLFGDPPQDFAGVLNLEVVASDGSASLVRAFQVVIANVNDAPTAADDIIQVTQSQPIVIPIASLLANDADVDGNPLAVTAVASGPGVTATLDGSGNVVLTREPGATGDLSFTYTVSDGEVTDTATVVVTVQDVNDPPVIGNIPAQHAAEDSVIDFILPTDIATDLDGDVLTFTATRQGGNALPNWLTFDPQTLRFTGTPPANFFGVIGLTLVVSDGQATASRNFDLVIDPVNDAPVISAPFSDRFVNEDSTFDITLQQGLFSDVDGNPLTYTITLADGSPLPSWITAQHQLLRLQGRAPDNFNGSIDIKVTASDGSLTASDYFKLSVNPINDAPVLATPLADKTITTGKAFAIDIPATTFTDPDGDPLQFAAKLANGQALPSWMTFDGTKITGTAPYAQQGTMDIQILASDGTLQNSDIFRITFERGNAAPVANNDSGFTVRSGAPLTIDADRLLANDTDTDGDALKIVGYSQAGHGSVSLGTDGNFTYVTAGGYYGNDQFVYVVSDGKETATATVSIVVDVPYDYTQTGGSGSDMLLGSIFGNSFLSGGNGNDTLLSFFGDDRLMGGAGNDLLYSLSGDDILDGGLGDDQLFAGSGNDVLSGGKGNDTLYGGAGRDEFLFSSGDGSDRIADYQASLFGDRISLDIEGIDDFNDLLAHAQEQNGGVLLDFGNGDELFLSGTRLAALDRDSFTFY
ncbi:Bacterial Ig domain protein [compost metagenome]